MGKIIIVINRFFDIVEKSWEGNISRKITGMILVIVYLLSLIIIELNIRGLIPASLKIFIPENHFYAINIAFTLLLIIEVIDLVLGIARSVSIAMGKQLEIFSLILLRKSFKEFTYFSEPIQWNEISNSVLTILSGAGGALVIFVILIIYYKMIYHYPITDDEKDKNSFITTKKTISLTLLVVYAVIGIINFNGFLITGSFFPFFDIFYTILIFTDVLIVLISLRYSHTYHVVFRNSGFALATVTIRLALIAPTYFNIAIGAGAALFSLGLAWSYNRHVINMRGT